jgi:uncharacterized repeat protein (TIGR03803 family)
VFAINTDGTGFKTLYSFTALSDSLFQGNNTDGAYPTCGLILSSNTLYGVADAGGNAGSGTVFAINTDGTSFRVLYSFTAVEASYSTNGDGAEPIGRLIISGNALYGTAYGGGISGHGTVFKLITDGTGFTTLHCFTAPSIFGAPNSDGYNPYAGLVISGNTLYGTTSYGANAGGGAVFSVNTDGTHFEVLRSFSALAYGTNSDGYQPFGQLLLSDNTLYGTAYSGGTGADGTVFRISLPTIRPQLHITPDGANVILSWPTNATGLTLQSTTNLASPIWTLLSPGPVVVNGRNTATNPVSGTQQFYRLMQ